MCVRRDVSRLGPIVNTLQNTMDSADDTAAQAVAQQDWTAAASALDAVGHARLPGLLPAAQCLALAALYAQPQAFRSRIVMQRHGFGRGEYQYFAYPLPPWVQALRQALYPRLAPIANRWNALRGLDLRYPDSLQAFLARCHAAGQTRPTPLMLRYGPGDYNCLHQDLYGEHVFPLQVVVLLSQPGEDFSGGEFVMTETYGGHARADVVPLCQGDAVAFTVHQRPVAGPSGRLRAPAMRHGVSQVRSGRRQTLGLIFHDAC